MFEAEARPEDSTSSPKNRSEAAYLRLRDLIVEGRIAPGKRLVETEIAERLDISRTPVRSALQRLEQEGYIQSADGGDRSRPVVAPLTREDAHDLLYLVGAIEGLAARRAAGREEDRLADLVERLREINAALATMAEDDRPDRNRWFDLDTEFHRTYVEAGGGERLRRFHASIKPQAERYIRVYVAGHRYEIDTSIGEHRTIINAIDAGEPDWAEQAVVNNWRSAEERLRRDIEEIGERGSW